jgi:hypothetical protein
VAALLKALEIEELEVKIEQLERNEADGKQKDED